jgi:hypothetical protein
MRIAMKLQPLLTTLMGVLLMTGNVYAEPEKSKPHTVKTNNGNHYAYGHYKVKVKGGSNHGGSSPYVVPEIDAASGTSAIALLTGILLLAGEKVRSKRTRDKSGINEA